MPVRAARLNKRITLRIPTEAQNQYSEKIQSFTTFGPIWAAIEPLKGDEVFDSAKHGKKVTSKIIIRKQGFLITTRMSAIDADGIIYLFESAFLSDDKFNWTITAISNG